MEVDVHAEQKMVCIWLTHADEQNPDVQNRLPPLYKCYKEKKYTVAVFHSGNDGLEDLTRALVVYNRKRLEEVRMNKEKQETQLLN